MLSEHERSHGLGMGALVSVCSWNTILWFGHGRYSDRMLLEHYGLGMDAAVTVCSWNTNVSTVWAWICSSDRMLLEQKRYYGLGPTVTVCSWNTNVIMVWAWMLQ